MLAVYSYKTNVLAGASGAVVTIGGPPGLGLTNLVGAHEMLQTIQYVIQTGAGVSAGVVSFQDIGADGTPRTLTTPVPVSINQASVVFSGSFTGLFHGITLNLTTALAGGNITYIEVRGAPPSHA